MENWLNISYLAEGSPRQREAFAVLRELQVMEVLAGYRPLLAGTVPLDLQLPGSDLDILCEVYDPEQFMDEARQAFGTFSGFNAVTRTVDGLVRAKINFEAGGWPVELFGQPLPAAQQNGFRHMLVEWRILHLLGGDFREAVIRLKGGGLKTEPAFARQLQLPGDPYEAVLALGKLSQAEFEKLCTQAFPHRAADRPEKYDM
ncbi:DUF4269 domain-containing protein [Paenibacillus tengchongensis]|uniref:DUF4269 domain-containing protein n=1 Tax=Paenibacillus tengchongensis TaxID=2608684 RepID=UPI001FE996ED|nr:DUF4269 domain-containing protein [Paenibacillus tengchongensis]